MTQPEPMAIAVIYSQADTDAFLRAPRPIRALLCMTANAEHALSGMGIPVILPSDVLGDKGHHRTTARVRHAGRQLSVALSAESDLGEAARTTLRNDLYIVASSAVRLWLLLGVPGPWLIWGGNEWYVETDRSTAHRRLLESLYPPPPGYRDMVEPAYLAFMTKALNGLAAWLLRRRRPIFVTAYLYGIAALSEQAARRRIQMVQLRGSRRRWRDLRHPLRTILGSLFNANNGYLIATPAPRPKAEEAARRALTSITDPVVRAGLAVLGNTLAAQAGFTEGLVPEMRRLIQLAQGRSVIAHTMRWSDEAALGEGAGRAGVWRLLASHGSHTPQPTDPFAAEEHSALADGMLVSKLADATLVQSPLAAALATTLMPKLPRIQSKPVIWGFRMLPVRPTQTRRRILHAGTYKSMLSPRPTIFETSDEFLQGIRQLAEAAMAISNVELVIRVRPRPECSIETIAASLPKGGNWVIKTDGSFLDDLASADMLVSYSSTTLEEALHARRPVLLWGGSMRYRHLQPTTILPMPDNRAAVYAPKMHADLRGMISAILDAHAGNPLTDEEVARHVNGATSPGAEEILDLLVRGGTDGCNSATRAENVGLLDCGHRQ